MIRHRSAGAWDDPSVDLVMKVAEPTSITPPRRLHPVDRALLADGPRPFWLLHPAQGPHLRTILALVGLDGAFSARDRAVLRTAASLSRRVDGTLHVVLPWDTLGESILSSPLRGLSSGRWHAVARDRRTREEDRLRDLVHETLPGIDPALDVRRGDGIAVAREAAWEVEADVVVSGGSRFGGFGRLLLGALEERMSLALPCSLLLVSEDGWDDGGGAGHRPRARTHPVRESVGVDA